MLKSQRKKLVTGLHLNSICFLKDFLPFLFSPYKPALQGFFSVFLHLCIDFLSSPGFFCLRSVLFLSTCTPENAYSIVSH